MRVVVCHAGTGNVRSVVRAVAATAPRAEVVTSADPDVVARADVLVVPGQGAFGTIARAMATGGLGEALAARVRAGAPYLGICLGLQVLFDASDEAPGARGLGVLRGVVRRLDATPLPHVGWNEAAGEHYYFAHSYAVVPDDARVVRATTTYGDATFASVVAYDRVLAVQFHPEKSQRAGLALLRSFFEAA